MSFSQNSEKGEDLKNLFNSLKQDNFYHSDQPKKSNLDESNLESDHWRLDKQGGFTDLERNSRD